MTASVDDLCAEAAVALRPLAELAARVGDAPGPFELRSPDGATHVLAADDLRAALLARDALAGTADEVARLRADVQALRLAYAMREDGGDLADGIPPVVDVAAMERADDEGRLDELLDLVGDGRAVALPEVRDRVVALLADADGSKRLTAARALGVIDPAEAKRSLPGMLGRETNRTVRAVVASVLRSVHL